MSAVLYEDFNLPADHAENADFIMNSYLRKSASSAGKKFIHDWPY